MAHTNQPATMRGFLLGERALMLYSLPLLTPHPLLVGLSYRHSRTLIRLDESC